jgi:hypothetical protein
MSWHPALAVLLGPIVLAAAAAAVIARKRGRRIYIAADVERALGIAPIAVLPDFSEVSDEVTEAHLTQLISAMNPAGKERKLTNCIFTGLGPGAGTTTVAARVKESLESMGNAPLIVNVGDAPDPASGQGEIWAQWEAEYGGLTEALLHHAGDAAEGHTGQIVLADAAPLATSMETEWLVAHAECAIVVIESGTATRAELRAAANILKRLKAPPVRVVLNRMKMAKADAAYRRSVEEMTRSAQSRDRLVKQQTLETLRFAVESGRAGLDPEIGLGPDEPESPEKEMVSFVTPAGQPVHRGGQATQAHADQASSPEPRNPEEPLQPIPWWLAESPTLRDKDRTDPRTLNNAKRQPIPGAGYSSPAVEENAKPGAEQAPSPRLPRLTELRGTMFSTGIKELDRSRHGGEEGANVERLMSQIAPFEALLGQAKHTQNGGQTQTAQVKALLPAPEPEAPAAGSETGEQSGDSQNAAEQLDLQFPMTPKPTKRGSRQDARDPIDKVEILPSRRGQYKRKD